MQFKKEKGEECGVFGISNSKEAVSLTVMGLFALQHRGEEACGITYSDEKKIISKKGKGLVNEVFSKIKLNVLKGKLAIGHNRYSVTGSSTSAFNIQPLIAEHIKGNLAIAHNGNITNAKELKMKLEQKGSIFQTGMDTEIFLHLIITSPFKSIKDSILDAIKQVEGSFCLLIMTKNTLYATRDKYGLRPLCIGKLENSFVISSETCALDLIGAKYTGQVHPGELITIKKDTLMREFFTQRPQEKKCIFELIYFSRPDSLIFGESVYQFRKRAGKILAQEAPVKNADMIIPIPDSGVQAALGYAEESKIPFEMSITRNHYVGRSFIQPNQTIRESFVKIKLNPIKNIIENKKIVLIDDSIVRGTTTKQKIEAFKKTGVKEIHMRIACSPLKHSCYYGIDFPDQKKLIAHEKTVEQIRKFLGLDSLAYLSLEGLLKASENSNFCDACFTGNYPIKVDFNSKKEQLENQN